MLGWEIRKLLDQPDTCTVEVWFAVSKALSTEDGYFAVSFSAYKLAAKFLIIVHFSVEILVKSFQFLSLISFSKGLLWLVFRRTGLCSVWRSVCVCYF